MARKITPTIDPKLPKIPVELDGKTFYLCFSFPALALAEAKLREVGTRVNLLHALDLTDMHAEQVVPLLFAALLTHQPDTDPVSVAKLVTFANLPLIFKGLSDAYIESLSPDKRSEGEKQHPPSHSRARPGQVVAQILGDGTL